MNPLLKLGLAVLCAGVFSLSVAGEKAPGFGDLDVDGDGFITETEASNSKALKMGWKAADSDADGRIDSSEFSAFEGSDKMFQPASEGDSPEPGAAPN